MQTKYATDQNYDTDSKRYRQKYNTDRKAIHKYDN